MDNNYAVKGKRRLYFSILELTSLSSCGWTAAVKVGTRDWIGASLNWWEDDDD